ncbi:MAG: hypothetical protein ACTTH7_07575 [Treponema sp.]
MKKFCSIVCAAGIAALVFAQESPEMNRAQELTTAAMASTEERAEAESLEETTADTPAISNTEEVPDGQENIAPEGTALPDAAHSSGTTNKERYDAHKQAAVHLEQIDKQDTTIEEENESTAAPPKKKVRAFSMHSGLMLDTAVANNLVSVLDFLQPQFTIDLNAAAKKMIPSGAHIGGYLNLNLYSQFTVLETHTIRFFTTADADVWGNIPKNIFEVLAQGTAGKNNISGTLWGKTRAFAATGLQYTLKKPIYSVSAKAAYFVPVAYMNSPVVNYQFVQKADGGYKAVADVDAVLYTPFTMLIGSKQPFSVAELFQKGGIDLTLEGSYTPASWVDILFHVTNLPIMPATMDKGIRKKMHFEAETKAILQNIGKTGEDMGSFFKTNTTEEKDSFTVPEKKVMRQCKLGVGADFKPFSNNYLIINPRIAFPITEIKPFYADAGLKLQSKFARDVLSVYYDLDYTNRMWRHEVCFTIDSRWFSLNLAAALASHSFARTFTTISGLGVKFGIGLGF